MACGCARSRPVRYATRVETARDLAGRVLRLIQRGHTRKGSGVPLLAPRHPQWSIGRHSYGNLTIHDFGDGKITIGDYCSIATEVAILLGGEHRSDWITTYPFTVLWPEAHHINGHPASKGEVTIGNDVWIGYRAIILSGVTIGDGAVIGAGSVVASDIPDYAIAAGNPCKVIRMRFAQEEVSFLKQLK